MTLTCFIMVKLGNALCILECFAAPDRWESSLPAGIVEARPVFEREFQKLRVLVLSCCSILHPAG